jgi:hypothetical protein
VAGESDSIGNQLQFVLPLKHIATKLIHLPGEPAGVWAYHQESGLANQSSSPAG